MRALVFILIASACMEPVVEIDEYECVEDPALTYETFGREFLSRHCNDCHNANEGRRRGAPESYRFETLEDVKRHRNRIFARSATTNVSMPPGPNDPGIEEREALATWLACGAR